MVSGFTNLPKAVIFIQLRPPHSVPSVLKAGHFEGRTAVERVVIGELVTTKNVRNMSKTVIPGLQFSEENPHNPKEMELE